MRPDALQPLQKIPSREALLDWLPKNAVVAEIGVAYGEFATEILQRCRPKRLHLIDLWAYQHPAIFSDSLNVAFRSPERHALHLQLVRERFEKEIAAGQVILHQGYSDEQLKLFPDAYFDWVYIDANHAYDTVRADLWAADRTVKPGGYICGHDYVEKLTDSLVPYGVIEAVNEFCREKDYELAALTEEAHLPDPYPSYALQRSNFARPS